MLTLRQLTRAAASQLQGKTDQRFVEAGFKLFRDLLSVKTYLTPAQFFEQVRRHQQPAGSMHATPHRLPACQAWLTISLPHVCRALPSARCCWHAT